jgi:aminoglycoside phosphotransferase family enzyme/predicted kinase
MMGTEKVAYAGITRQADMIGESPSQSEIIAAMQKPEFYPHPVQEIILHETNISWVFLTGNIVYKVKKPVDMDFLDFTTLKNRQRFCRQEVDLNRRLARNIYLGVVSINMQDNRFYLNGPGPAVEYAVKMRQLAEESSMVRMLSEGKIEASSIDLLARTLFRFYNSASTGPEINVIGSWRTVRQNCEENFTQLEEFEDKIIDRRQLQIIRAATRSFLRMRKLLFDERVQDGKIRECHGDLRTEHIYFTEDGIQIIDCIEFNERFRYSDVVSDLAFLAMDLDFKGYHQASRSLLKTYVDCSKDLSVFRLLDFYKCYRALVRVKVDCFRFQQGDLSQRQQAKLLNETEHYLELAYQYAVQFTRPTLWVVCGMIAAGKSTVARSLAGALGIRVLRSDVVRKKLFESQNLESEKIPFEEGIYSKEATSLTYGNLFLEAQEEIKNGKSVVLDASFSLKDQRKEALRLAEDMDTDIIFVECICDESTIKARLRKREKRDNDEALISDARLEEFEPFQSRYEALDEIPANNHIRIHTDRPVAQNVEKILSM